MLPPGHISVIVPHRHGEWQRLGAQRPLWGGHARGADGRALPEPHQAASAASPPSPACLPRGSDGTEPFSQSWQGCSVTQPATLTHPLHSIAISRAGDAEQRGEKGGILTQNPCLFTYLHHIQVRRQLCNRKEENGTVN